MSEIIAIDGSSLHPIGTAAVVRAVHEATLSESIPYVIVGAAGRDLVLEHVHDVTSPAATRDVDFAVMVNEWSAFEALRTRLTETYGFEMTSKPHRLISPQGLPIDLIPFGDIEDPEGEVSVPPHHSQVMVTLGFPQAYEHAHLVEIDGVGPIRVASLVATSMLKLLAWRDRREPRDAEDLALLLKSYYDLVADEIYVRHGDLFDEADFDKLMASARVLGRDAGMLSAGSERLRTALVAVLDDQLNIESRSSSLAIAMGKRYVRGYENSLRCLGAYRRGFDESGGPP